jgi:hypothetical protein
MAMAVAFLAGINLMALVEQPSFLNVCILLFNLCCCFWYRG